MKKNLINIGVGFDQMRILHDGLGEFSVQLGKRIAAQASEWRQRYGVILVFICAMNFMVFLERTFFTYLRIKIRSLFIELALSIIYGTRLTNMPNLQPH